MVDKLMYIHNFNTQNYSLCRLQIVVETFGHQKIKIRLKSPKLTSVINSPLSPRSVRKYKYNRVGIVFKNKIPCKSWNHVQTIKSWILFKLFTATLDVIVIFKSENEGTMGCLLH